MTKPHDIFQSKKGKKGKMAYSDKLQPRSLSSSSLAIYADYGNSAPSLLTQNLSGGRSVQRSLSSGSNQGGGSFLCRLHLTYPQKASDYEMSEVCGTGATAKVLYPTSF